MKNLESQVLAALKKAKETKERYTFTISPSVKAALKAWCAEKDVKESAAIEAMIQSVVPNKFFKR